MNIVIQKANASITDVTHMAMAKTRTIVQDRDETIAELLRLVDQQSHLIMLQSRIMEQLSNAIKGLSIILAFFVLCALILKLSARRSKVEQQQKG
jgi:L-lactate utilization protein LutC